MSPDKPDEKLVTVREDVIRFLLGEGPLGDKWYGDRDPGQPAYWWRNPLRLSMHPYTPSAGQLTPAEAVARCAAIVDEMQEAWHDSEEEHSGHYMDAAQRIADVLRERAKHPPFTYSATASARDEEAFTVLGMVEWLQRWWRGSSEWCEEQRKQLGPDVAHLMRGVANMIETGSVRDATDRRIGEKR